MHQGFEVAKFQGRTLPPVTEVVAGTGVLRGNPIKANGAAIAALLNATDVPLIGVALNDYGSSPGSQIGMASYVNVLTPSDSANRVSYVSVVGDYVTTFWGFIKGASGNYDTVTSALVGSTYDFVIVNSYFLVDTTAQAHNYVAVVGIDTQLNRVLFHFTSAAC